MNRIYLDWNATAPMLPEVREAMVEALGDVPGNASSIHREGQQARARVESARRAVAGAVNAPGQSVVLTGGATESNNQVLNSHVTRNESPRIVSTAIEHPSVLEVVEELGRDGVAVDIWPVDDRGRVELEWLEDYLKEHDEDDVLVSVMWANNETGNVYPVEDVAELTHEYGARIHVDATQALGRMPVDFEGADIDFMTLSFHKMGGPKGIGAVVVREGLKVDALMAGGHQERGRRPGTENIPAAVALERAANLVEERTEEWNRTLQEKRRLFRERLEAGIDEIEYRGDLDNHIPNTLNVAFEGIDGEDFLLALDLEGVAASSGSACTAGSMEPSHVILAMGYEHSDARRSIRFSFGPTTTDKELEEAAERVANVVNRLQGISGGGLRATGVERQASGNRRQASDKP